MPLADWAMLSTAFSVVRSDCRSPEPRPVEDQTETASRCERVFPEDDRPLRLIPQESKPGQPLDRSDEAGKEAKDEVRAVGCPDRGCDRLLPALQCPRGGTAIQPDARGQLEGGALGGADDLASRRDEHRMFETSQQVPARPGDDRDLGGRIGRLKGLDHDMLAVVLGPQSGREQLRPELGSTHARERSALEVECPWLAIHPLHDHPQPVAPRPRRCSAAEPAPRTGSPPAARCPRLPCPCRHICGP